MPAYTLGGKRLYILMFEIGVLVAAVMRYRRDPLTGLLGLIGLSWFAIALGILTPFFRWAFSVVLVFSLLVAGRLLSAEWCATVRRAVWALTMVYAVNNVAGDVYVLGRDAENSPYGAVAQALDDKIPDSARVLTQLEFWFAFQRNPVVYTPLWSDGVSQLLADNKVDVVVLSRALAGDVSPTTGQKERLYGHEYGRIYATASSYARRYGKSVEPVATRGYGEVEIWTLSGRR